MKSKSIVSLLLAMLLLILPAMPVSAAGDPAITVDMPDTIEPGTQFTLSVNIENNPGWSAFQFEITYDTANIQLLDVEDGEAMKSRYAIFSFNEHTKGQVTAIGLYNDTTPSVEGSGNMEKDGALLKMYFKVLDTAVQGADVSVKVDVTTFCNAKLEPQMDPTVVKSVAKVGTMAVEDNKTQPSKSEQAVVSGMIGTYPSWTVSKPDAEGGATNAEGQATNAEGQVTNANGDVVESDEATGDVPASLMPLVLIVIGVVVVAGVAILIVVTKKKK